jgi:hypothetical protein
MNRSAHAKWRRIIKQQQSSGWTITGFCRKRAVPMSSFYAWKRRLSRPRQEPAAFVAVKPIDDTGGGESGIELRLANGRRVMLRRGFDQALLVEVLDLLEGRASRLEGRA